jgi:glutathione S-transferase
LADIAVACPLINVCYCSSGLKDGRWPRVKAWLDGLRARPSFAGAMAQEARMLGKAV